MKIRKANRKDIPGVLGFGYELGVHMGRLKKAGLRKGRFYRIAGKLTLNEKAVLIWILRGFIHGKKRFSREKLKKGYPLECKMFFLKKINFDIIVDGLIRKGFVRQKGKYLISAVPKSEATPICELIGKHVYVDHMRKKKKSLGSYHSIKTIHLVAEERGKLLGYLKGYIIKNSYGGGELEELVVTKRARGKSIGSKLVKEFLRMCEKMNATYVHVVTAKENKETIKFYRRCGFKKGEVYLYWTPFD